MDSVYDLILDYRRKGIPIYLITAVSKEGMGPVEVGKKMIVAENGDLFGTVGGGKLEHFAVEKARRMFSTREPLLERYALVEDEIVEGALTLDMVCGGVVSLFYEYLGPKADVLIFGGGHVGQALANLLRPLDYRIVVIDERKPICEVFKNADQIHNTGFVEYIEKNPIKPGSYIVVCTPSHKYDYHVLNKIIDSRAKPKYMGMLCSKAKLDDYLEKTYETFGKNLDLSNFYAPIGLDLGGNRPEDIAVSIVSEILAVSNGRGPQLHMRETNHGKYRYWED